MSGEHNLSFQIFEELRGIRFGIAKALTAGKGGNWPNIWKLSQKNSA